MQNSRGNPVPVVPFVPVRVSAYARERTRLRVGYRADAEQNNRVVRL